MNFQIKIDEDAFQDIIEISDWYYDISIDLGIKFKTQTVLQINSLKKNPEVYAIRYEDVRCMLIKKFPFLVHFTINDNINLVEVFAIFHTSRNPEIWKKRRNKI